MSAQEKSYGILAEFDDHRKVLAAARKAYEAGYRRMDAYTPFPVEGLAETIGKKRTAVPLLMLLGGITGGCSAYFMQYYAMVIDYPLNIGGRPLHSWPSFIPITFELTVLGAALTGIISSLALNRLPRLHHPVFGAAGSERASMDRFFLCIEARDPQFEAVKVKAFLESLGAENVQEVEE